jgi:hypothetical protein
MIPLFRKLRKQWAEENKRSKYMRYAIGEIILVVIGILIALQINNWNEHHKKLNSASEHLQLLTENLEDDLIQLEDVKTKIDSCLLSVGKLSQQFKMVNPIDAYTPKYIMSALLEYRINPSKNGLETLNNSGEFSTLKSNLQSDIFNYYILLDRISVREEISNTFIKNRYEPYFFEHYSHILNKDNPWGPLSDYYADDPRQIEPFDQIKFLQDKQLEGLIFGRTYQMKQQIVLYTEAIELANQILLKINSN